MDIDQFHKLLVQSFGDKLNEDPERVYKSLVKAADDLIALAEKIRNMDKSGFKSVNSVSDRVIVNVIRADSANLN